jgi:uncharacterized protein with GYD domain
VYKEIKRTYKRRREKFMAYYVILTKLTDEGRKTIKQKPERMFEVNKELESMGVKVKEQFAVLGPYDFVNIVEAPNNETVMKMSVELGARGSVQLLTLPAVTAEEFVKKLK